MTSPVARVIPDFQLFSKDFLSEPKDILINKFSDKFRQFKEDEKKYELIHLGNGENENEQDKENFPSSNQSLNDYDLIDDLSSDEESALHQTNPAILPRELSMPASLTRSYYNFSHIPNVNLAIPSPQKPHPDPIIAEFLKV